MWAASQVMWAVERVLGAALFVGAVLACNQNMDAHPASYVGVGVELTVKGGVPSVVRVIDGSPASQAGLVAGSTVVRVDGQPTQGKGLAEVVNALRGPPDSEVTLEVARDGAAPYKVLIHRKAMSRAATDGGSYVTGQR
jgi:C-terminal processing protease CtpA/Prc